MTSRQHDRAEPLTAGDIPPDGFGAGYLTFCLAEDFHALCCVIGKENARQEIAEIINREFEGSRRYGA